MFKLIRCCIVVFIAIIAIISVAYGRDYKGFNLLHPDECIPLDKKAVLQLPLEWHKYVGFVKICNLRSDKSNMARISIITIWAYKYYTSLPAGTIWEELPQPLIVDNTFKQVGQLPEVYPDNPPCTLDIFFGKWRSGIPTEIRVDVNNPTVTGDYYYSPIVWDNSYMRYEMKDQEEKYGKRPK